MITIYAVMNDQNDKIYIGQTVQNIYSYWRGGSFLCQKWKRK